MLKDNWKCATQTAIERGDFGLPTLIIDDELFRGNDRFELIGNFVNNRERFDATSTAAR